MTDSSEPSKEPQPVKADGRLARAEGQPASLPVATKSKIPAGGSEVIPAPLPNFGEKGIRFEAISVESHVGPLPPPTTLQGYEALKSGAVDIIFEWADEERHHRHEMERRDQENDRVVVLQQLENEAAKSRSESNQNELGMWVGSIIGTLMVLAIFVLGYVGRETTAVALTAALAAAIYAIRRSTKATDRDVAVPKDDSTGKADKAK